MLRSALRARLLWRPQLRIRRCPALTESNCSALAASSMHTPLDAEEATLMQHNRFLWQDGRPATAEDLKMNFKGLMGHYAPQFKGVWNGGQLRDTIQEIQIVNPHHIFIKTTRPHPFFLSQWAGVAYYLVWYRHAKY
jgi:ABC-type transport system substrate-binding protein